MPLATPGTLWFDPSYTDRHGRSSAGNGNAGKKPRTNAVFDFSIPNYKTHSQINRANHRLGALPFRVGRDADRDRLRARRGSAGVHSDAGSIHKHDTPAVGIFEGPAAWRCPVGVFRFDGLETKSMEPLHYRQDCVTLR